MLLPLIWGIDGVWVAIVVTEVMAVVFSVIFLVAKRGKYHYLNEKIYSGFFVYIRPAALRVRQRSRRLSLAVGIRFRRNSRPGAGDARGD